MQTNKEQLQTSRKQYESAEENVKTLEKRAEELITELDTVRSHCSQLNQEKDMLQKGLDTVRIEKNALDKSRVEINSMVKYIFFFVIITECFVNRINTEYLFLDGEFEQ